MPSMNPISASELASIQADMAALLDKDCTIKRKVRTPESQGGATTSLTTIDTVKAGMAQPTAGQLQNYGYLVGSLAAWQVKFAVGVDVQEQDLLHIDNETLSVAKILTPRSYPALVTVLATEVK